MGGEAIDAVYTWVDDAWPGYSELLQQFASDRHDLNPNRYRDNLSILKYSLRSLERHLPWIQSVVLVTARPQVPPWLDPSRVRIVHHDTFMAAADLPTFNSFAIVANLHRIEGLTRRFLYVEDDHLFGAPVGPTDLFDDSGKPRVRLSASGSGAADRHGDQQLSPWNRALAYANHLLDEKYGRRRRRLASHSPVPIEIDSWHAMIATWPGAFAHTSASRFRATGNVTPEHLYPHFLLEEQRGTAVPFWTVQRQTAYHPVNNVVAFQRANLARLGWQRPLFCCLNDNFGAHPNPRVVTLVRETLERWFPRPSRFEVAQSESGAALS